MDNRSLNDVWAEAFALRKQVLQAKKHLNTIPVNSPQFKTAKANVARLEADYKAADKKANQDAMRFHQAISNIGFIG